MLNRRVLLSRAARVAALLAATGWLPRAAQAAYNASAFQAKSLAELLAVLGGAAPTESPDVGLNVPEVAENGALVPVSVSSTLPGVKRLLVLVDKNPNLMSAMFDVSNAVDAHFTTRVKLSQSSRVYAVAFTEDGQVLFAQKQVQVTLGGCGG